MTIEHHIPYSLVRLPALIPMLAALVVLVVFAPSLCVFVRSDAFPVVSHRGGMYAHMLAKHPWPSASSYSRNSCDGLIKEFHGCWGMHGVCMDSPPSSSMYFHRSTIHAHHPLSFPKALHHAHTSTASRASRCGAHHQCRGLQVTLIQSAQSTASSLGDNAELTNNDVF